MNLSAVRAVTEEEYLEIRRFGITVDAGLCEVHAGVGLEVDGNVFHALSSFHAAIWTARTKPAAHIPVVTFPGLPFCAPTAFCSLYR